MIKMAAEIATNAQQIRSGIVSTTGAGSGGATLTDAAGGLTGVAVNVMSG